MGHAIAWNRTSCLRILHRPNWARPGLTDDAVDECGTTVRSFESMHVTDGCDGMSPRLRGGSDACFSVSVHLCASVCVKLCVCICVCYTVCVCVHLSLCICVCAYACVTLCACVRVCVCMCARACVRVYECVRVFVRVCVRAGLFV